MRREQNANSRAPYVGPAGSVKEGEQDTSHGQLVSVSEEGTVFRSYRDGSTINLTPESSVDAQKKFGADIIIPLDELRASTVRFESLSLSLSLSLS